jgi:hypothetical protein
MAGYWRRQAEKIIWTGYQDGKNSGLGGRALRRFINQRFPQYVDQRGRAVGRKKYPYRVWLDVLETCMVREEQGCNQMILLFG